MKKLSLLVALALLITVGGVYATWTYTQTTDVADESVGMAMNLTGVAYAGSYGAYEINRDNLKLTIDPKTGTSHTTSLKIEGELKVTFTPATFAPAAIKENGVPSTFSFSLSNDNWKYDDGEGEDFIVTLKHTDDHDIEWTPNGDGTFSFTLNATQLAEHIELSEFELDTKSDYDSFTEALRGGQIVFSVSDGDTTGAQGSGT